MESMGSSDARILSPLICKDNLYDRSGIGMCSGMLSIPPPVSATVDIPKTALSKTPKMFVISRNSTFTYKGKPVKIRQVSEEMGVRYVLEGSLQKSNDQLRINAQLIDAITGNHLWAEKYDRNIKDIFALQDDITMKIITALQKSNCLKGSMPILLQAPLRIWHNWRILKSYRQRSTGNVATKRVMPWRKSWQKRPFP